MSSTSGIEGFAMLYRVAYEGGSALWSPLTTPAERMHLINKLAIATFDFLSTAYYVGNRADPRFFMGEAFFRFTDLGFNFYLLKNDPHKNFILTLKTVLLSLNISRLALMALNPAIGSLQSHLLIASTLLDLMLRIPLATVTSGLWDKVSHDFDFTARTICHALSTLFSFAAVFAYLSYGRDYHSFRRVCITGGIAFTLAVITQKAIQRLFNVAGIHPSWKRSLAEWSFAVINSLTLSLAISKRHQLIDSVSTIFRQIIQTSLIGLLMCFYPTLIELGLEEMGWGFLNGHIVLPALNLLSSFYVTSNIAIGLGLAKTEQEVANAMMSCITVCVSTFLMSSGLRKINHWLHHGTMSWKDLKETFPL